MRPVEFCAVAAVAVQAQLVAVVVAVIVAVIVVVVGPQPVLDVQKTVHLVLVAVVSSVPSLRGSVVPILE